MVWFLKILGTCLSTFVFISRLKTEHVALKIEVFFYIILITLATDQRDHRAGSQLKTLPNTFIWWTINKKNGSTLSDWEVDRFRF